ncbi:sulfhydryl oxidase 2-like [Diadema antillarum]|uniref:sulfhydryl oxidase 2-like n=1 Tax=Diadema antillarum TaxID=105358 RepID=UPI003A89CCCC
MAPRSLQLVLGTSNIIVIFAILTSTRAALYSPNDHVVLLDGSNFAQSVYNSEKVWIIEFFSSWCGHCVHFAPTWKSLAEDLRHWKHAVLIAAIDCAEQKNNEVCRSNSVHAYPSIKFFDLFTKPENATASTYKGARDVRVMREAIAAQVEKQIPHHHLQRSVHWPDLNPVDAPWVGDFFTYHSDVGFLVVIFQGQDNFMGKEIILDVMSTPGVYACWMRKADNPLVSKWGVVSFPSVYVMDRTGFRVMIQGPDRKSYTDNIFKFIKANRMKQDANEPPKEVDNGNHANEETDQDRFLLPLGGVQGAKEGARRSEGDEVESDFDGRDVDDEGNLQVKEGGAQKKEDGLHLLLKPGEDGDGKGAEFGADTGGAAGGDTNGGDAGEVYEAARHEAKGDAGGAGGGVGGEMDGEGDTNDEKVMWERMQAKNREKAMQKKTNVRLSDQRPSEWPKVYMLDLESVIQYSLRQEVSLRSMIEGAALQALIDYVAVLKKYLPLRKKVSSFLETTHKWLVDRQHSTIPIEDWLALVDPTKKPGSGLANRMEFIGCRGSEPHFRGYPCGLWTLFHTLTVSQASLIRRYDNVSYMEVLHAMRGYILSFFSCQNCRENFHKEVADLDSSVTSLDDAILWLWRTHNHVNKRLRGDPSEDPEHPKVSFPPREMCASCYASTNVEIWEESRVLGFLKEFYSMRNFDFSRLHLMQEKEKEENGDMGDVENALLSTRTRVTLNPDEVRQEVLFRLRQREMDIRLAVETKRAGYFGLGINSIDVSLCMMLNISCIMLIVCIYFVLAWRRRRTRKVRLLP